MIRIENFIQLKAFARQDALILSLLWIASFACVVMIPAGALGNLLALTTPFIVAWRLSKFRDQALNASSPSDVPLPMASTSSFMPHLCSHLPSLLTSAFLTMVRLHRLSPTA